jgi:hypothetical protein
MRVKAVLVMPLVLALGVGLYLLFMRPDSEPGGPTADALANAVARECDHGARRDVQLGADRIYPVGATADQVVHVTCATGQAGSGTLLFRFSSPQKFEAALRAPGQGHRPGLCELRQEAFTGGFIQFRQLCDQLNGHIGQPAR